MGWENVPVSGIKQINIIKKHIEYPCSIGGIRLSFDENSHGILGKNLLCIICDEKDNIDVLYMLHFHDGNAKYPYKSLHNSIRQLIDFDRINYTHIDQKLDEDLPSIASQRDVTEQKHCILIQILSPRKLTFNQKGIKKYKAVQIVLDEPYLNDYYQLEMQLSEMRNYAELNDLEIINTFEFSRHKDLMGYVLENHKNIDLVIFPGIAASNDNLDQFYFEDVHDTLKELLTEFKIVISPCIRDINSPDEFAVILDSQTEIEQNSKLLYFYKSIHESNRKIPLVYVKTYPGGRDITQVRNELYRYCYRKDVIFSERVCDSTMLRGFETEGFKTIVHKIRNLRTHFDGVQFTMISNDINLISDIGKLTFLYNHGIDYISIVIDSNEFTHTAIYSKLNLSEENKLQVTHTCID
jgi:hypothetical protein